MKEKTPKNNSINNSFYTKGESIMMKKMMILAATVVFMMFVLTGCRNPLRADNNHATVSIVTSTGGSGVGLSYNGSGMISSGKEFAIGKALKLKLKEGETAKITFTCDACGNKQEIEVAEPFAEVLHCDCPEKIDQNGNAREYSAITISYGDEEKTEK